MRTGSLQSCEVLQNSAVAAYYKAAENESVISTSLLSRACSANTFFPRDSRSQIHSTISFAYPGWSKMTGGTDAQEMEHMPTLIVILDDGTERRIPDITRAAENNDAVVALNEHNHVKARFALRDVRSWYVEEDQQ
jgi:hypothetical protein